MSHGAVVAASAAAISDFDGTQPVQRQSSLKKWLSITTTFAPKLAAARCRNEAGRSAANDDKIKFVRFSHGFERRRSVAACAFGERMLMVCHPSGSPSWGRAILPTSARSSIQLVSRHAKEGTRGSDTSYTAPPRFRPQLGLGSTWRRSDWVRRRFDDLPGDHAAVGGQHWLSQRVAGPVLEPGTGTHRNRRGLGRDPDSCPPPPAVTPTPESGREY